MTSIQVGNVAAMAFMNRLDLSSAEISGDVAPFAFYGCTNLKKVRFGAASQTISEYAFYGCTSLEDVEVPQTIAQIGDCAFASCSGTVTFMNPMAVNTDTDRKISNSTFVGSNTLSIRINTGSGVSFLSGDYLGNGSGFLFNRTVGAVEQTADTFLAVDSGTHICSGFLTAGGYPRPAVVAFPTGVVALAPMAFRDQVGITSIVLPSTLVRTGEFAFYGCTQLKSIFYAEGIPLKISAYSFYGCTSLTEMQLQNETLEVGDCAFGNSGLTTIRIGYSWGFTFPIAQSAFYSRVANAFFSDPSLTRTSVNGITDGSSPRVTDIPRAADTFLAIDPVTQVCTGFLEGVYPQPEILVIPSGVREIGDGAFARNTTITSVFIPSSVVSIGANAFAGCSALSTVFYRSQTAFDSLAIGAGAYTGTDYIADMKNKTPAADVVITAPAYDIVSVVWTPTAYTYFPRVSYRISVSGDLVATLSKPSPLSHVLYLTDPKLYVVEVQAMLFGSDEWGTPQTLVVDNRSVGQTPAWWPNYTANRVSLETVLAERYAPQLLSVSDAYPLTYYLSDGGTISGGLTEYAVEWSRRTSNAAYVMLLFIYRVMMESTDAATVKRGEQGIVRLIPQIIQMPPAPPVVSATVFADSVYCKWVRPSYFWDCYASYRIYVDAGPVTADVTGTQALLNGLSIGTHTIGISSVNLLGMEGSVATTTVIIEGTVAAGAADPPVHTLLKDGVSQIRLNDAISLAEDPVLRGYVRMLGAPCIETAAAAPSGVYLDLTGDQQLTATWTAPPPASGLSSPVNYLVTATNQTNPSMTRVFDAGTTNTTYVLNGLVGWDFYIVSVQAVYEEGVSLPSAPSSPIQVVSVPPAPVGLMFTLTSAGGVSMNWNWYYISFFARILSHTVEFVDVNDPSSTRVITDIVSRPLVLPTQASIYKFRVRAVNRYGAGPWSAYSRRLGAYAVPDAPVLTGALAQGKSPNMSFMWTTDNPGPDILEYVMTVNGREVHLASTVNRSDVTGLSYGTLVTVTIRAVNVNGSSEMSNTVSLLATSIPDAPTWVEVQERDLRMTLTWTPPEITGGLPVLDYMVFVYNQDTDEVFEYMTTATTFIPPVLTDGATYNVAVSARNEKGEGDRIAWPEPITAFLAMPPDAPTDVGFGTWGAPMSDGGAPIEGYEVRVYTMGESAPRIFDVGAEELSIVIEESLLQNIYCVTVAARNRRGYGLVAVAPSMDLQNLVAVPSGDRAVRVSWAAPGEVGFPGVLSYNVRAVLEVDGIVDERLIVSEVPVVEFTDLLVPISGEYRFQISVNYREEFVGVPIYGETTCVPVTAPGLVQNLRVTQEFDDRIVIAWMPPMRENEQIDDGGSPIIRYVYTIIGPYSQLTSFVEGGIHAVANKPRDAGSYTIRVAAANAYVVGEFVEFSPFAYTTLPGMPRQLGVDAVDSTTAIVRWLAPLSAGGLPVVAYDVEYYSDTAPDSVVRVSTESNTTYKTLSGLDSETVYTVRVRTVTSKGVSCWTDSVVFSFAEDLPPRVAVSVVKIDQDLQVSWTELPDARYVVAVASASEVYTMVTQDYLTEPSFMFTPTEEGTYTFRVMAISVVGAGQWSYSEPFTFTTDAGDGVVCFLGNAPVLTPTGYRRIDSLGVGDEVRTADGRDVVIQRVLQQRVRAGRNTSPYRIQQGQFGALQGVWISPEHRVSVPGGSMVEARRLGLVQMKCGAETWLKYYNLELPDWERDNMIVAGVEVESMAPLRRVRITQAELVRLLRESYGGVITPALVEQLRRKCVFFTDGTVEVPIVRPAISTILSS